MGCTNARQAGIAAVLYKRQHSVQGNCTRKYSFTCMNIYSQTIFIYTYNSSISLYMYINILSHVAVNKSVSIISLGCVCFSLVFFSIVSIWWCIRMRLKARFVLAASAHIITVRSEPFFIVNFVLFLIHCVHNRLYCGQRGLRVCWRGCGVFVVCVL